MIQENRYKDKVVLAIGAHPDDIEIGIGGTVARWQRAGARLVMVVASIPNQYDRRLAEARRSAEILGGELRLPFEDGRRRVEDFKMYELVRGMDTLVEELEPAAVFTHGPSDFHRDHSLIYEACVSSQRIRVFDFFSYYPTSCRPVPVSFRPQVFVDISSTLDVKMKAIEAHPSQFAERGIDTEFFREMARTSGRLAGVTYAEGVEVSRIVVN